MFLNLGVTIEREYILRKWNSPLLFFSLELYIFRTTNELQLDNHTSLFSAYEPNNYHGTTSVYNVIVLSNSNTKLFWFLYTMKHTGLLSLWCWTTDQRLCPGLFCYDVFLNKKKRNIWVSMQIAIGNIYKHILKSLACFICSFLVVAIFIRFLALRKILSIHKNLLVSHVKT